MPTPRQWEDFARQRIPAHAIAFLFALDTEEAERLLCEALERIAQRRRQSEPPPAKLMTPLLERPELDSPRWRTLGV
jgi:hypothetical protein